MTGLTALNSVIYSNLLNKYEIYRSLISFLLFRGDCRNFLRSYLRGTSNFSLEGERAFLISSIIRFKFIGSWANILISLSATRDLLAHFSPLSIINDAKLCIRHEK